jgi:hypothetical protein
MENGQWKLLQLQIETPLRRLSTNWTIDGISCCGTFPRWVLSMWDLDASPPWHGHVTRTAQTDRGLNFSLKSATAVSLWQEWLFIWCSPWISKFSDWDVEENESWRGGITNLYQIKKIASSPFHGWPKWLVWAVKSGEMKTPGAWEASCK